MSKKSKSAPTTKTTKSRSVPANSKPAKTSKPTKAAKSARPPQRVKPAKHIELIARALIIESGHILLCQNRKHGYYYLPGGHVDPGETSPEAVARECHEEFRGQVTVGDLLAIAEVEFQTKKETHQELNLIYSAKLLSPSTSALIPLGTRHSALSTSSPSPFPSPLATRRSSLATSLPAVISVEDYITFRWLTPKAIKKADLRPTSIKDWLLETLS